MSYDLKDRISKLFRRFRRESKSASKLKLSPETNRFSVDLVGITVEKGPNTTIPVNPLDESQVRLGYHFLLVDPSWPISSPGSGRPADAPHLPRINNYLKHLPGNTQGEACRLAACRELDAFRSGHDESYYSRYTKLRDFIDRNARDLRRHFPGRSPLDSFTRGLRSTEKWADAIFESLEAKTGLTRDQAQKLLAEVTTTAESVKSTVRKLNDVIATKPVRFDESTILVNDHKGWHAIALDKVGDPPPPLDDGSMDIPATKRWIADSDPSIQDDDPYYPAAFIYKMSASQPFPPPCTCVGQDPHGHCVECGKPLPHGGYAKHLLFPGVFRHACPDHWNHILTNIETHGTESYGGLTGGADGWPCHLDDSEVPKG